jgi:hypothetical protein
MTAEQIVDKLLEADEYGPPAPDNFTQAQGTMKELMGLERQKLATMQKLGPALGLERQLRKHGVTRDQVTSYIRAQDKYPGTYNRYKPNPRGQLPPDAIVGIRLNDQREIIFDMAIMPEHTW